MPKIVPRTKQGKDIDKFFKKITATVKAGDVVIPVLGPTGPGKSTFINNVLGPSATKHAKVSDGLASCTLLCETYTVDGPLRRNADYSTIKGRLVLVDTPGFDDSRMTDSEVVDEITKSLNSLHSKKGVSVAGIVYMLPIFPARATASTQTNLKTFEQIYSQTSSSIVALVTTRWNLCSEEAGSRREAELRKSMWGDAQADALVLRLNNEVDSAWAVVDSITHRFVEKQKVAQPGPSTTKGKAGKANKNPPQKQQSLPKASSSKTKPEAQPGLGTGRGQTKVAPPPGGAASNPASGASAPGKTKPPPKAKSTPKPSGPAKQGIFGRLIQTLLSLVRKPPPVPKTTSSPKKASGSASK